MVVVGRPATLQHLCTLPRLPEGWPTPAAMTVDWRGNRLQLCCGTAVRTGVPGMPNSPCNPHHAWAAVKDNEAMKTRAHHQTCRHFEAGQLVELVPGDPSRVSQSRPADRMTQNSVSQTQPLISQYLDLPWSRAAKTLTAGAVAVSGLLH